jgi:YjbE family integral membrane protein
MLETITLWVDQNWLALCNVIMIDVVLAGDNAIVVGLAASQVAPSLRARVIFWGIAGAVVLRIAFAGVASQLLQIVGLTLAGGLLLLWVCWKMYRQILEHAAAHAPHSLGAAAVDASDPEGAERARTIGFWPALWQIIVADVSMSLDNVLAVAGAAKGSPLVLIIGLAVAVALMAVASHYIAGLLTRHRWIMWVGLAIIVYVALDMIYNGSREVACNVAATGCQADVMAWLQEHIGHLGLAWPW